MRTILLCVASFFYSTAFAQRDCGTDSYWQEQLRANPGLIARQREISIFTDKFIHSSSMQMKEQGADPSGSAMITIPVVVHILYEDPIQNISEAQVQSQIDVLNADFRSLNSDIEKVPNAFAPLVADCQLRFELAKVDPEGRATNGIVRKQTGRMFWVQDDRMKKTSLGGDDPWDSRRYLNIWVCNLFSTLLGYSTFPGAPPDKDGVVIRTDVFGINTSGSAYSKGRTTTHEIGHWLNLKHLWGDAPCGDDGVDDTPQQKTYSNGCPSFPNLSSDCNPGPNGDLFMDFMDFTDDACMQMFTQGQKQRIWAIFAEGGPRSSILTSNALGSPWIDSLQASPSVASTPNGIFVYPNPANMQLRIRDESELSGSSYMIYNSTGRLVLSGICNSHTPTINIGKLAPGIYFLKLIGPREKRGAQFIKN